jgi:hypothetical protein
MVRVEMLGAVPDAPIWAGENEHVEPKGRPLQARLTVPVKL